MAVAVDLIKGRQDTPSAVRCSVVAGSSGGVSPGALIPTDGWQEGELERRWVDSGQKVSALYALECPRKSTQVWRRQICQHGVDGVP